MLRVSLILRLRVKGKACLIVLKHIIDLYMYASPSNMLFSTVAVRKLSMIYRMLAKPHFTINILYNKHIII